MASVASKAVANEAVARDAGLLLDSNILIDVLRGEQQALAWLQADGAGAAISVISWIEILVGCQGEETTTVQTWLQSFPRLELNQAIAAETVSCRKALGLKIPDAIILATARCHGLKLVSRNSRDFPATLGDVLMPYELNPVD